ncbi:MAG: OmpA family protein [Vicinamibacterales bacterium]
MNRSIERRRRMPESVRDRWIISYADFVTLLFAFFTTLYAASTVDVAKLSTVAQGLQTAFDAPAIPTTSVDGVVGGTGREVLDGGRAVVDSQIAYVRTQVETELAEAVQAGQVEINRDRRGLIISIPETGAFPVGSADLSPALEAVMARLAQALERLPNAVRIEGHTDNVPIRTARFASNWDLSAARAISVVDVLLSRAAVSPSRISVAGYGEHRPRVSNTTPGGRSRNRRVDIVVLNAGTDAAEEPAPTGGEGRP